MKIFEQGMIEGFEYIPNFIKASHTALDVCDQYYHAKRRKFLSMDDYCNRWIQFKGSFVGNTANTVKEVETKLNRPLVAHVYANWIANGLTFGRHRDSMSVLIVQVWNNIGYCVESCIGNKKHVSYVLQPGDALYVHKGTWHTPIVFSERMSLSFSWM